MRLFAILLMCSPIGCGAAMKSAVTDQCNASGLKACPELAQAIVLQVDGKSDEAAAQFQLVAQRNSPEKVQMVMKAIEMVPGVDLSFATPPKSAPKAKTASEKDAPELAAATQPAPKRARTGVAIPSSNRRARDCAAPFGDSPSKCLTVATGPVVLTDVHASPECEASAFVALGDDGGNLDSSQLWAIAGSERAPLMMHGARLSVAEDQTLIIGSPEGRGCHVVWATER
jgi:hypothetical protein